MGGVSILFRGGHLEVEISSCWDVYFLGGIVIYMGVVHCTFWWDSYLQ